MPIQVQGAKTFRDLHPGLTPQQGGNDFYFRYDWVQQVVVESSGAGAGSPRWTARTSAGDATALLSPDSGNPRRTRLTRPPQPGWVEVSDGGGRHVRVWFLRASLQVVGHGRVSSHNPRWPAVQAYLTSQYAAQGHDFGRLGPVQFRVSDRAANVNGVRYGGMVEIVGAVEPADLHRHIPVPVWQARRITGVRLSGRDAQGRSLLHSRTGFAPARPGQNDSSLFRPQDAVPLGVFTGELTATGHVLDYDMPGGVFTSDNWPGDVHEYHVEFEQVVWIGSCSGADPWPDIESRGLALSPVVRWSVHLRAEVTSTATSAGGLRVNLTGTVG